MVVEAALLLLVLHLVVPQLQHLQQSPRPDRQDLLRREEPRWEVANQTLASSRRAGCHLLLLLLLVLLLLLPPPLQG